MQRSGLNDLNQVRGIINTLKTTEYYTNAGSAKKRDKYKTNFEPTGHQTESNVHVPVTQVAK